MQIYIVKQGDTLYSIGRMYGKDYKIIAQENGLDPNKTLVIGQSIVITSEQTPTTEILVNGYAYDNITQETLEKSLPYLSFISIFSTTINDDGSLNTPNDDNIIATANRFSVQPVLVLSNIDSSGSFSSDFAHMIFGSIELQNTILDNVLTTMKQSGYKGLDIDFEYIYPYDRVAYNNFLQLAADKIHNNGFFLTSALAPKLRVDQEGLLYEAHDYAFHGKVCDHVILMTYEWGYTYSPPMAVSPIGEVDKVLRFGATQMDSQKILQGVPNYGYDWEIPFVPGTAARAIGNSGAIDLARQYGAIIQYDEVAASPFFTYWKSTQQHKVYFEDARSIKAKLELVSKNSIGGISYWTINRFFQQGYTVLSQMYKTKKDT